MRKSSLRIVLNYDEREQNFDDRRYLLRNINISQVCIVAFAPTSRRTAQRAQVQMNMGNKVRTNSYYSKYDQ